MAIAQYFLPSSLVVDDHNQEASAAEISQGVVFGIRGDENSGKTTLLFEFAYNLAAQGGTVILMSNKSRIYRCPPLHFATRGQVDKDFRVLFRNNEILQRIHMKYFDCFEDFETFLMNGHLHVGNYDPSRVKGLFVDDIDFICSQKQHGISYSEEARTQALKGSMALLINLASVCNDKKGAVVGVSSCSSVSNLRRWLTSSFALKRNLEQSSDHENIFSLIPDHRRNEKVNKIDEVSIFEYKQINIKDDTCLYPLE